MVTDAGSGEVDNCVRSGEQPDVEPARGWIPRGLVGPAGVTAYESQDLVPVAGQAADKCRTDEARRPRDDDLHPTILAHSRGGLMLTPWPHRSRGCGKLRWRCRRPRSSRTSTLCPGASAIASSPPSRTSPAGCESSSTRR